MKAFKVLYGYAVTGKMTLDDAMYELDRSCEATRDLYLFMLAIISPLTKEAHDRIEDQVQSDGRGSRPEYEIRGEPGGSYSGQ